jgi:hypothetical protein
MKLFHTSPCKIEKITMSGNYDDCLFFSKDVYEVPVDDDEENTAEPIQYLINAENMRFVEACDLYDEELINVIVEEFEVESETAKNLLNSSDSVWNHWFAEKGTNDFVIARRGECATNMGFDGYKDIENDQEVFIIPMFKRESILEQTEE